METLEVALRERSYPIFIGSNLLSQAETLLRPYIKGKRVMVVTNETVAPLYLDALCQQLHAFDVDTLALPDGEQYKDLAHFDAINSALLAHGHGRDTTIIALGGGVIGDITGFAAACYQRGVDFIQIPTTLLSQVDSSVGGKTAINHPLGKNMVGAFYQPKAVLIDIHCLQTLPPRELSAGMAEVIKYGIIWDHAFFEWLEHNMSQILSLESEAMTQVIKTCCQIKADVVAEDETERGVRALLNLGHTFGHAIEAEQGYGNWLHGEAVAAGMVLAARLACMQGDISSAECQRIETLIQSADLPVEGPASMQYDAYIQHMMRDKKVTQGELRLVLPQSIGKASVIKQTDMRQLEQLLNSN